MSIILTLAFLFFIGSVFGWVLELFYRNLTQKHSKWINPGFCTGPYLPIYGFGLCLLFLLASLERFSLIQNSFWNKALLFLFMAVGMTLIEYLAGLFCLKFLKVRLWDYSNLRGNVQGLICPLFSFFWTVLGAVYYFWIHPHILDSLHWLSRNLAFSFFIGMFYGILLIDVAHSGNLAVRLKQFAEENGVIVRYEALKDHILASHERSRETYRFFRPFREVRPLKVLLKEMEESLEDRLQRKNE